MRIALIANKPSSQIEALTTALVARGHLVDFVCIGGGFESTRVFLAARLNHSVIRQGSAFIDLEKVDRFVVLSPPRSAPAFDVPERYRGHAKIEWERTWEAFLRQVKQSRRSLAAYPASLCLFSCEALPDIAPSLANYLRPTSLQWLDAGTRIDGGCIRNPNGFSGFASGLAKYSGLHFIGEGVVSENFAVQVIGDKIFCFKRGLDGFASIALPPQAREIVLKLQEAGIFAKKIASVSLSLRDNSFFVLDAVSSGVDLELGGFSAEKLTAMVSLIESECP